MWENWRMQKKPTRLRKPFVLFEVMLAFALIGICFLPLFINPSSYLKKELQFLEKLEFQRISENRFADILQLIYEKKIPWKKIEESSKSRPYSFSKKDYFQPWILKKTDDPQEKNGFRYHEEILLWTYETRKTDDGKTYLGVVIKLIYTPVLAQKEFLSFTNRIVILRPV